MSEQSGNVKTVEQLDSLIGVSNSYFYPPDFTLPKDRIYIYAVDSDGVAGKGSSYLAVHHYGAARGHVAGLKNSSWAMALLSPERRFYAHETVFNYVAILKRFMKKNPDMLFILGDIALDAPKEKFPQIARQFKGLPNCLYPESFRPHLDMVITKG